MHLDSTSAPSAVKVRPARGGAFEAPASPLSRPLPGLLRFARVGALALTDQLALLAAGFLAYAFWALPVRGQLPEVYLPLLPLLLLFNVGYALAGLYPGLGLGPVERLRRFTLVTLSIFLVLASASFSFKLPHVYSRMAFVLALSFGLVAVPLARSALLAVAGRWRWWREPVLVATDEADADALVRHLRDSPALGYEPAGLVEIGGAAEAASRGSGDAGVPWVGGLDVISELAREGYRMLFVQTSSKAPVPLLDSLQACFANVIVVRGAMAEAPVDGVQARNLDGILAIEYTSNLLQTRNRVVKRGLDLALGLIALVATAPLVGLLGLMVKLVSPGPLLFRQRRQGLDGRYVVVPKIRTMRRDAQRALEQHLEAAPELRAEWNASMKLRNDPRLVPVLGKLLRRYSLDELPQLWSVVKGDLSLVGPRPFPDYHLEAFSPDFLRLRQRVRPGITGLWQVTVRSAGTVEDQELYDSYYIRNWSLWLDLYILARTLGAVVSGRGAY